MIVVVEDNPTDVFLVREALAKHRLEADLEVVRDGEEALNLIERFDADRNSPCPHLMLLDINLPRTNGLEVLERLRGSKKCANMAVVVMTSSAAKVDQTQAAGLAVRAYFQKPAKYDAFLQIGEVIESILTNSC